MKTRVYLVKGRGTGRRYLAGFISGELTRRNGDKALFWFFKSDGEVAVVRVSLAQLVPIDEPMQGRLL